MRDKDVGTGETESLRKERGERPEVPAGPAQQEKELPLGPMREAVVGLHAAPEEEETVQADRAEAARRGELEPE